MGSVGQLGLLQGWVLSVVGTVQLGHLHPYCTGVQLGDLLGLFLHVYQLIHGRYYLQLDWTHTSQQPTL